MTSGETTSNTYDGLCRLTRQDRPGGDYTITEYFLDRPAYDPTNQSILTRRRAPGPASAPDIRSRDYLDGFGRTWRTVCDSSEPGRNVRIDTEYNARGEIARTTAPYFEDGTPRWTQYGYDALDRLSSVTNPDATVSERKLCPGGGGNSERADRHGDR